MSFWQKSSIFRQKSYDLQHNVIFDGLLVFQSPSHTRFFVSMFAEGVAEPVEPNQVAKGETGENQEPQTHQQFLLFKTDDDLLATTPLYKRKRTVHHRGLRMLCGWQSSILTFDLVSVHFGRYTGNMAPERINWRCRHAQADVASTCTCKNLHYIHL